MNKFKFRIGQMVKITNSGDPALIGQCGVITKVYGEDKDVKVGVYQLEIKKGEFHNYSEQFLELIEKESDAFLESLVGKSTDEAKEIIQKIGYTPRITNVDGKAFIVTRDFRTDRVNLVIENGSIKKATIG